MTTDQEGEVSAAERELYESLAKATKQIEESIGPVEDAEVVDVEEPVSTPLHVPDGFRVESLLDEEYREYIYRDAVYTIANPKLIFIKDYHSHRVVDMEDVVHVPSPGWLVLRWKAKDPNRPVEF